MLVSKRVLNLDDLTSRFESDHLSPGMVTFHTEYPNTNLLTDDINQVTMAWGQRRSQTWIETFFPASALPDQMDYVALFGVNRQSPTISPSFGSNLLANQVRLIIDEYSQQQVHRPNVSSTNFSVTNLTPSSNSVLNQVINPPETVITGGYSPSALNAVNDTLDTVVNLEFNNNSNRPYSGTQEILIHARDSVDTTQLPTLTVVLRQSGADIATLSLIDLERTFIVGVGTLTPFGGIYRYTFNSTALTSTTSPIQLRITGETTGARSVDFLAVDLVPAVSSTLYDTGWQDLSTLGASGDRVAWAPRFDFPTSNGHYVIVEFSDYGYKQIEGVGSYILFSMLALSEPLQVGRFAAGSAIDLPLREQGVRLQKSGNNLGNLIASRGGTLRASRIDQLRWEAGLSIIPQSQGRVFGEIETFLQSIGAVTPTVYVLRDSDIDPGDIVPAFFGVLSSYELTDIGLLLGADYTGQTPFIDKRFEISLGITDTAAHVI